MPQIATVNIPKHVLAGLRLKFPDVGLKDFDALSELEDVFSFDCVVVDDSNSESLTDVFNQPATDGQTRPRVIQIAPGLSDPGRSAPVPVSSGADAVLFTPIRVGELARQISNLTAITQMVPNDTVLSDGLDEMMTELWERARPTVTQRIETIESAVAGLLTSSLTEELRGNAETEAHRLAGSLGTYSFHEGSKLARELELAFVSAASAEANAGRLPDLVDKLRESVEPSRQVEASEAVTAVADGEAVVLLLMADEVLSDAFSQQIKDAGIVPISRSRSHQIRSYLAAMMPTAAILNMDDCEGFEDGLSLVDELSRRNPPVAVFALTDSDDFQGRLSLVRAGASMVCDSNEDPATILAEIDRLVSEHTSRSGKILMVDDDETILAALEATLARLGHRVRTLGDPLKFWEVLGEFEPDLLLVDVDMPGLNGYEICRLVRSASAWADMPVIFLTAQSDGESVARAFSAGASDFVSKPPVGPELVVRIESQLRLSKESANSTTYDPATGALNRETGQEQLKDLFDLAETENRPFVVAEIHPVRPSDSTLRRINQAIHGLSSGRTVSTRWSPDVLVVGRYGFGKHETARILQEALESLELGDQPDGDRNSYCAGVAESPGDGRSLESLILAASGAREQVELDTTSGVGVAGERDSDASARVDVVLVDDDPTLADLVIHALDARGISHHWIMDGPSAIDALTGDGSRIQGDLILLDVNLPGADGLTVLRALGNGNVLDQTRVVILTGRSSQDEVIESMRLGASDHVAKPFSVSVLMSRIETLLAR